MKSRKRERSARQQTTLRARSQKSLVEECVCCHVSFDPNICSQCQVAGCANRKKGENCRLTAAVLGARKLSPFQMVARIAELETHLAHAQSRVDHLYEKLQEAEAREKAAAASGVKKEAA